MRYVALLLFLLAGCSKTEHKDHLHFDCPDNQPAQVKPGPDGGYIISCPKERPNG